MLDKKDLWRSVNTRFYRACRHEKIYCYICEKVIERDFYLFNDFAYHFSCFKKRRIPEILKRMSSLKETNQTVSSIGAYKWNERTIIDLNKELKELEARDE